LLLGFCPGGGPRTVIYLLKHGEYPIYDVKMKLYAIAFADTSGQGSGTSSFSERINIGDIPAGKTIMLREISLTRLKFNEQNSVKLVVRFEARNGTWDQILYLRNIKSQWLRATAVFRVYGPIALGRQTKKSLAFIKRDDGFPTKGLEWIDSLDVITDSQFDFFFLTPPN